MKPKAVTIDSGYENIYNKSSTFTQQFKIVNKAIIEFFSYSHRIKKNKLRKI